MRWLDEWKLYEACSSAYLLAQGLAASSLFATHSIEKVDLIEIQTAIAASSNYDDGKTVQFILVLHNFVMLNRFNRITSHWGIFPISKGSRIFTTRSLEYFMCVLCKLFPFFVFFIPHFSFYRQAVPLMNWILEEHVLYLNIPWHAIFNHFHCSLFTLRVNEERKKVHWASSIYIILHVLKALFYIMPFKWFFHWLIRTETKRQTQMPFHLFCWLCRFPTSVPISFHAKKQRHTSDCYQSTLNF